MLTLSQAADLTTDRLIKGVIKSIIFASPLLDKLPFDDIEGNADAWNVEDPSNPPAVGFYSPGAVWGQDEGQTLKFSTALTTLGGDVDIPRIVAKTRSKPTDQVAARVEMKSRAIARAFERAAIYGDPDLGPEFPGLHEWLSNAAFSGQLLHAGSGGTPGALSLAKLDEAIDLVDAPDAIICNKQIRRRLTTYLRANGSYNTDRDEFGRSITVWGNDIPILACDGLTQTETISGGAYSGPTGGSASSLFVVHFGVDGLSGIQNGGIWKQIFDSLEDKDAIRVRLGWYVGLALRSIIAVSRIDGIADAAVTA